MGEGEGKDDEIMCALGGLVVRTILLTNKVLSSFIHSACVRAEKGGGPVGCMVYYNL